MRYIADSRKMLISYDKLITKSGWRSVCKFVNKQTGVVVPWVKLLDSPNQPYGTPRPNIWTPKTREFVDHILQLEDPDIDIISTAASW